MAKMKKGVLFTIGITMLVTIVFSLALLLFHNTQSTENRFSELALLDRLSDLDGMIQNNIRDINYYASGLSIEVDSDSVTFRETISRGVGFAQLMTDYQSYIEETYPGSPEITFDETDMSNIKTKQSMQIRPYGIVYEHDSFPGESYTLNPGTAYEKILEYNIELQVYATSLEVVPPEPTPSSGLPVSINIVPQGGGAPYVWEGEINPAIANNWQIKLLGSTPEEEWYINIVVGGESDAYLDVDCPAEKVVSSTLEILLLEPTDEPIEVKYPEELFTIHFEESKLIKKGTVKLA